VTAVTGPFTRLHGAAAVAGAQLRHHRQQTLLCVLGVALAVLLVVLLVGVGHGALSTGNEAVTWFDQDLWVTTGAIELAPTSVGGVANPIHGAHGRSAELEAREDVARAQPVAFQTVYVGTDPHDLDTVVGVGVGGDAGRLGTASRFNGRDRHYAGGSYDGPMTHRIVVDERTASRYGIAEDDTLHVGGTVSAARGNEFTVVGVTDDLSNFLGAPTVGIHLSELQEVSGTTGTDPAALIALTVAPGHDPQAVARAIESGRPSLRVRTGKQVRATVGGRPDLAASALGLVGVAVVGGLFGLAVALPAVAALNHGIERFVGYAGPVSRSAWLLAGALRLAVAMGVAGASVAGWRVARLDPTEHLRS